jgi:hypothetical protein
MFSRAADTLCPLKVGDELLIDAVDAEVDYKMNFLFNVTLNEHRVIDSTPLREAVQKFTDMVSDTVLRFKSYLA